MGQMKRSLSVLGFSLSIATFLLAIFAKYVIGTSDFSRIFGIFPNQIALIASIFFMGTLLSQSTARFMFTKSILDSTFMFSGLGVERPWSSTKKAFALSLFAAVSFMTFKINEDSLLVGIDGQTMLTNLKASESFSESMFFFSNNPLQGLGTTPFYQVNFAIDPGYILLKANPLSSGIPLAYTLWSLLLLSSCMAFCRSIKLDFQLSLMSSSLAVFFLVYPHNFVFNVVTFLVPHVITTMSITMFMVSLLVLDWRELRLWQIYGRRFALAFLFSLYSLHNPNYMILLFPLLASFAIVWIFRLKEVRRPTLRVFDVTSLALSAFCIIMSASFSASLILYSAAFFHGDELQNTYKTSLNTLSVIFSNRHTVGLLVILAMFLIVADYIQFRGDRLQPYFKVIRVIVIFGVVQTLLSSLALVFKKSWRGPLPFYFEFPVFPLFAVFIGLLLIRGVKSVLASLGGSFSPMNNFFRNVDYRIIVVFPPLLYLLSFNVQGMSDSKFYSKAFESEFSKFVNENRISDDSPFTGRFESFLLQQNDRQLAFSQYSEEVVKTIQKQFGSSFRFGDLWKFNVPTLVEYHANFSPRSYELTKTLLSSQNYTFARTGSFFTKLRIDQAELLGVSKAVTNSPIQELRPNFIIRSGDKRLYFYKLRNPNLGQVSPANVVVVDSLNELKRKIQSVGDLKSTVLVEKHFTDRLAMPATTSSLKLVRGGYRIIAKSNGKSMILLPIEYSSCYTFYPQKHDKTLELVDANIAMTLVVFDRVAEFEMKYRHGPFINPFCKFRDFARYRSFVEVR